MADPIPSSAPVPVPEEDEFYSSWSLFLVCLLLILSLWTSYYLQIKRIRVINETIVSIFAGMFVGLVVRLSHADALKDMLTFRHTLFFNLLLPPIILNSGYELRQENFFRNFGSILTFAFAGTFVSAVGVGVLVYIWAKLGLEGLNLGLIECLIFGSTLSATDPVTVLAIFNQYKVDPKLYTIIFGESLLNDAVSIVMYETLSQFHGEEISIKHMFHGTGIFLLSFSGSMALGVTFGLGASLVLKHSHLASYPRLESCLVALSAYTCYFFSNGIKMSGIVSLLFCGITLKHYAYHTMSRRTQRGSKALFGTLAQLSENFIFVYLGLSLFTSPPADAKVGSYFKPLFVAVAAVAVVFTRYAAVFPLSEAINFFLRHARGQRVEELPHAYQMMLFWAGLRGAVGVALAAGFQGPNAQTLRVTVLVVVLLTVVVFGGTTARMLEALGIRTGVDDEPGSDSEEEAQLLWPRRAAWSRYADDDSPLPSPSGRPGAGKLGIHYGRRSASLGRQGAGPSAFNHQANALGVPPAGALFESAPSEYDSDGEVLPLAPAGPGAGAGSGPPSGARTPVLDENGRWFQALDERYLLPLFSNATASRTFHARRAQRRVSTPGGAGAGVATALTPADSEDEDALDLAAPGGGRGALGQGSRRPSLGRLNSAHEDARGERRLGSPVLRSGAGMTSP